VELTYNWDPEPYTGGRNFGHLAYAVDNIYDTCSAFIAHGVTINRPPRDGRMAFICTPDGISIELLWRSLKYEEVYLKAYANGLEARIGIGQWLRFYNERRPHQALGYKTPAAAWAAEVSPVDLPLRLDDAGASPTTPQGQQQQTVVHI
jgi:hypothetical protein